MPKQAVAVMWAKSSGCFSIAVKQVGCFQSESISLVVGEGGICHKFVHESDDNGVVGQFLQWSPERTAFVFGYAFGVFGQSFGKGPHFIAFVF